MYLYELDLNFKPIMSCDLALPMNLKFCRNNRAISRNCNFRCVTNEIETMELQIIYIEDGLETLFPRNFFLLLSVEFLEEFKQHTVVRTWE